MFNSKYSNIFTILLVIAIIAVIALIGYFGYDIYRKYYAKKDTDEAVDAFQEQYGNYTKTRTNTASANDLITGNLVIDGINSISQGNDDNNTTNTIKPTSVKPEYKGFTMVGTIEISKINLKYPILEKVSDKALDTAVCLMYGKLNTEGNTVIIGHNYRNGTFFSNLYKLSNGDKITISDYTGKSMTYTVYSMFEVEPEDMSVYKRETNGATEITLITCTDDSKMRTAVYARAN